MLIEDEDVEVPARHPLVARDLRRHGAQRRLAVDACGFLHVLEQQHGKRPPVLDDLDLVRLQIRDGLSGPVGHADVEAHDVHARPEHPLRTLLCVRRHAGHDSNQE